MKTRTIVLALALVLGVGATDTARAQRYDNPWWIEYPHLELGLDLGVMLWNAVDRSVVRPGVAFDARLGWDLKWWVPMTELGFRVTGLSLYNLADAPAGTGSGALSNIFLALGMRFKTPNETRVIFFIDGFFDFNWWRISQPELICPSFQCNVSDRYLFTPGLRGRAGLAIRVAPHADLEVAFGAGFSFKGQFLLRNRSWLEPSLNFTYSFPAGYQNRTRIEGY